MTKRLLTVTVLVLLTGALAGVTGASSQGSKSSAVSQGLALAATNLRSRPQARTEAGA